MGATQPGSPNKNGKGMTLKNQKIVLQEGSSHQRKDEEKGLKTPTSVSMKNSYIIKNADVSFDHYYAQMKKRKHGDTSIMNASMAQQQHEVKFGIVPNKKPTARDGHSMNVDEKGRIFLFGGDRHHMPFNDLYMLQLP